VPTKEDHDRAQTKAAVYCLTRAITDAFNACCTSTRTLSSGARETSTHAGAAADLGRA